MPATDNSDAAQALALSADDATLFAVSYANKHYLKAYNVTNSSNPVEINVLSADDLNLFSAYPSDSFYRMVGAYDMTISPDGHLFIPGEHQGTHMLDAANPSAISLTSWLSYHYEDNGSSAVGSMGYTSTYFDYSVAVDTSNKRAYIGGEGGVRLFDISTVSAPAYLGMITTGVTDKWSAVFDVAFSPDGQWVAQSTKYGVRLNSIDAALDVFDTNTAVPQYETALPSDRVAFTTDSDYLFSYEMREKGSFYDIVVYGLTQSGLNKVATIETGGYNAQEMLLSADGKLLFLAETRRDDATGEDIYGVYIYDVSDPENASLLATYMSENYRVEDMVLSSDGRMLYVSFDDVFSTVNGTIDIVSLY